MVVGVLEEAGVDLHLPGQDRLELVGHVVVGGDLGRPGGELGVGGDDPQVLLPGEDGLARGVPAVVEAALVLVGPLRRDLVGGVGRPWRVVHEEGPVGHERALLADPGDGLVGHVLGEVVALLGRGRRLERGGPLVDGGEVLVGLTPDEAVEVLEATARRPLGERPHRARLPDRDLVALAELRGGVPVHPQGVGQWCRGVGPNRAVPGGGRGQLGDGAHAHGVVVPAGQQGLTGGRTERGRVEPGVPQAARGQAVGGGRVDEATEGGGRAETDIVEEHDEHVGCPLGGVQRLDGREAGVGVLGVVGRETDVLPGGDRQ